MPLRPYRDALEGHYRAFTRRRYVHPDPVEFLYPYEDPADREIAALLASSLAYGNVKAIGRSVADVLDRLGPAPARFVADASATRLHRTLAGFRHRWTAGEDLAALLAAAGRVIRGHGSLGRRLARAVGPGDETVIPALTALVGDLRRRRRGRDVLADPARRSACKRLCLMLRWMVRRDEVDPGGWAVDPRLLVVPLDVHMHRLARALSLTARRSPDMATALEITRGFAAIAPADPVRYDFALTRLGIHPQARPCEFLLRLTASRA